MEGRGLGLAARFRAKLEEAATARRREEEAKQRWLEEARKARAALLDDLAAFGVAVGHLAVSRDGEAVVYRNGDKGLRLEPIGEADGVRVLFDGAEAEQHRLYREVQLKDRWVWAFLRAGREERLLLFDAGLEELMVRALGLPRPASSAEAAPAADAFVGFEAPAGGDDKGARKL